MKRTLLVVLGLLFALGSTARGVAAQDGGARSVFARGGGLRGLAMGGASTALSGDPSVLDWNPAGLAGSLRREIVFGRTSYFGEEISESYSAVVVPSWRWGATGISLRHLGTSGIERRDDRNQVLETDLSSSDLQLALAYARELGPAWAAGGTFKVQRQQLAGESASGFGVDLGLRLRPARLLSGGADWADGLAVAFAFANVIEPSWRLDEDTVTDPSAFRAGLAFERPFLSGGGILAALDLETTAVTAPEVRAGLEIRLHPMVSLRTGMAGGGATVGAGLLWNDLSFDYVLEDTGLGGVHRVGLSFAFGSTTDERRAAYVQRQEERLQQRLEESFARRQDDRVRELLASARDARAEGRFEDALATIDVARTLSPDREDARVLEAGCWSDRAAELAAAGSYGDAVLAYTRALDLRPGDPKLEASLAEAQGESDRRAARTSHLRTMYAQAMDAFARGDLPEARRGFRDLAAEDANDVEAAEMLRRTEEAIQREARRRLEQARSWIGLGRLADAEQELAAARAFGTEVAGLPAVEAELARRRQEAARDREETRRPERTQAPRENGQPEAAGGSETEPGPRLGAAELEDLYQRGVEASRSARPEDAIRYFELVRSSSPGFSQVRENLVREYLALGMERFAAGRLDDAISLWRRAVEVDPNDTKARGYLDRALRHRSRTAEILGGDDGSR